MSKSCELSVKPVLDLGCAKHVGLKSRPIPSFLAKATQDSKCLGSNSFRSTLSFVSA